MGQGGEARPSVRPSVRLLSFSLFPHRLFVLPLTLPSTPRFLFFVSPTYLPLSLCFAATYNKTNRGNSARRAMGKEPGGTQKNAKGPRRRGEGVGAGSRQGKLKGRGGGGSAEGTGDTCTRKKRARVRVRGNRTGLRSSSATDRPGFLAGNRIQLSGVGSSPSYRREGGVAVPLPPLHRFTDFGTWYTYTRVIAHRLTSMSERIYH